MVPTETVNVNCPAVPENAALELLNCLFSASDGEDLSPLLVRQARAVDAADLPLIVRQLARQPDRLQESGFRQRLMQVLPRLLALVPQGGDGNAPVAALLDELYRETPADAPLACLWLSWLAQTGDPLGVEYWTRAIIDRPPQSLEGITWAFQPLLAKPGLPHSLAERLFETGLADPLVAPAILDLFNHRFRRDSGRAHAAAEHCVRLTGLLRAVVHQMQRIEEGHLPPGESVAAVSQNVSNSVALTVSLCDTLGLCRHFPAEGSLRQALELKHRRIQTEAACALARLEIPCGIESLQRLAGEPVARLRVLAFAGELDLLDRIPAEHQSGRARAESRLAMWLAEPEQMGMAPSRIELIDERELAWPGFEQPVACFLFRFAYGGQWSAHGLVGPCVHAFSRNTEWMTPVELLSAFAGWQTGHPELYVIPADELGRRQPRVLRDLLHSLERSDCDLPRPLVAGYCFGEWILIAEGHRGENQGLVAVDGGPPRWYPHPPAEPLDPGFVWLMESGRRMLDRFNPEGGFG